MVEQTIARIPLVLLLLQSNILTQFSLAHTQAFIIMTSSFYPVTTDNYFDQNQIQSMPSNGHYSSSYQDDSDDDLDALRKAALQTLNSRKRKNLRDHSSSSSSRSSYTRSSISRSNSSSSNSSISSTSLDRNDKDYRFETKSKDIDERFPHDNADMLIVDCPSLDDDDDLQLPNERIKPIDRDERKAPVAKESKPRRKSPLPEHPVSITVRLNTSEFDLRQLIKKRRTEESTPSSKRVVQMASKDSVHKSSRSSRRTEKH